MTTVNTLSRTCRFAFSRCYSANVRKSDNLWTSDNIVRSPFRDVQIPDICISDHIWQNVERWPEKTAVVCGITNRSYTYNQLYKYSLNLAANFRTKLQISDGDIVCLMMFNAPEYALAVFGALQAGAELTTVNPIYTPHEVHRQLVLSKPKIIIGAPETIPTIKEALNLAKMDIPIITAKVNDSQALPEGTISLLELAESAADHSILKTVRTKGEDVALLPYSSGTTGLPKGVELTNKNIVVNCIQQDVEGMKQYEDTTGAFQESVVAVLPFYHIYGLSVVLLHKLSVGAKVVTLPKFQSNTFLTALKEHKVGLMYAAPPMVLFLGSHPDVKTEHLDYLKKIMTGAAPLAEQDVLKAFKNTKSNTQVIQMYGLTETSPVASSGTSQSGYKSAGFALSNTELKIVDSNSKVVNPKEVGELLIRGPQVMKGYRNNPEATKAAITEDGWFKSGDLAFLGTDGTVTIADRLKELIKVKGYQVPPAELENVLKEHPAVVDAGVVGIPDPRTGEAPKAFVVLKEGQKVDPGDIEKFVKERVAEYKQVKEVIFLDSLPKNPSGKLLRRVLKEKYC